MSTEESCQCEICVRSRKWNKAPDKKVLFSEMCNIIANCEFEEQSAKHESNMIREYLVEINEYDNYIKWRKS